MLRYKSVLDKLKNLDDEELKIIWNAIMYMGTKIDSQEPMEFFDAPTYGTWCEAVYNEVSARNLS